MSYTANVVYGCTGERSMYMGMDLRNLTVECALGETPVIEKEINLDKKKYVVSDLLMSDFGLKYDLILRMMLKDGVIKNSDKVQVGSDGRLREVFVCKTKEAYRIFGKTYHGKVS
jgi:hypothetical protein